MSTVLRILFHALFVRPFILIVIGLRVMDRDKLPSRGPAIIAANHNSHLDTAVLMSLFPLTKLAGVRPAAAADYFMRPGLMSWFSQTLMGIVPVDRNALQKGDDPFVHVTEALARNEILIVFPEGTRGEPEELTEPKKGIAHLIEAHPHVQVTPVFLRGLGKSLPKGAWLPVPFFCDVHVGDPIEWTGDRKSFMERVRSVGLSLSETK